MRHETFEVLEYAEKSVCPKCGVLFPYRSNKTYCRTACRKAHHKLLMRGPADIGSNRMLPSERRENLELFHLNAVLCERVYTMKPSDRVGYVEDVLQTVRGVRSGLLYRLLSNDKYRYPDRNNVGLFFRNSPKSYKTFPQMCNHYLLNSPWNCYLKDFLVPGLIPEPCTGEVFEDGTVDAHPLATGWKPAVVGHRKRKSKGQELRRYVKGVAPDPSGRFQHPWYRDGRSHRHGAKKAIEPWP